MLAQKLVFKFLVVSLLFLAIHTKNGYDNITPKYENKLRKNILRGYKIVGSRITKNRVKMEKI
jgi:hypothetical protein